MQLSTDLYDNHREAVTAIAQTLTKVDGFTVSNSDYFFDDSRIFLRPYGIAAEKIFEVMFGNRPDYAQ